VDLREQTGLFWLGIGTCDGDVANIVISLQVP
jgi:hypothetical protein